MHEAATTRAVTLVVADGDQLLGSVGPFEASTPWWQDIEPISRLRPELVVLRIIDVRAHDGAISGGTVRYLAEVLGGARNRLPQDLGPVPVDLALDEDPLRMPWARPGGPGRDLDWVASIVAVTGTPVQHRTWNLSAIWSVPTGDGDVWLKCLPSFLAHEGRVLEALSRHAVPELLARDAHRLLLRALPGRDGYDATLDERKQLIDALIAIQCTTVSRTQELLDVGVPDRRLPALLAAARAVVDARAPEDRRLRSLVGDNDARVRAIAECGLDDVLVHTDAHSGNARIGHDAGLPVWFDWGDSAIGHPILDVAVLERPGTPFRDELVSHWLDAWGRAIPGSDPHRAWRLIRPLAALLGAIVFQGFLDRIERSERIYHEHDVDPCLERAAQLAASEPL
jgi:hypothetical protein